MLAGFGMYFLIYQGMKVYHEKVVGENPALSHYYDLVDKDWSDFENNVPEYFEEYLKKQNK